MAFSDFYVTLPSNVSSEKLFPTNTIGNYRTKLAQRIQLSGEWEVGLSEISFTNSWFNLTEPYEIVLFDNGYYFAEEPKEREFKTGFALPAGRYDTIDHLLNTLNILLKNFEKEEVRPILTVPQLWAENETRHVYINYGYSLNKATSDSLNMRLHGEFAKMLGFHQQPSSMFLDRTELLYHADVGKITDPRGRGRADAVYDLNAGYHSVYVYTNVVKPQLVGDAKVQLLRVVAIPRNSKYGNQVVQTFGRPNYYPLQTQDFETIEIDLKNEVGESIPFQFGRVIVTLHFRRRK